MDQDDGEGRDEVEGEQDELETQEPLVTVDETEAEAGLPDPAAHRLPPLLCHRRFGHGDEGQETEGDEERQDVRYEDGRQVRPAEEHGTTQIMYGLSTLFQGIVHDHCKGCTYWIHRGEDWICLVGDVIAMENDPKL